MPDSDHPSKQPKTPAVARVKESTEAAGYHAAYQAYADTFRNWLVAYGIGGPLLFLSREEIYERVSKSTLAPRIVTYFLLGVGLQVTLAFLNKWVNWRIYAGIGDPEWNTQATYHLACKISRQAWIDFIIDLVTLLAFGAATVMTLSLFAGSPQTNP